MHRLLIICYILMSQLVTLAAHDIHVSVSDIDLKENTIEITVKTFLDDLQQAMGLKPGEVLPEGYSSAEEMISSYIQDHLNLTINDIIIPLIPSDIDASNDAVWITIQIENMNTDSVQSLTWNSTFLTDIYDDQTNIVNLKRNNKKEVFSLSGKKTSLSHQF